MRYTFLIGNLLLLIGVLPLIKEVLKHRKNLKGYSSAGAFLTFIGVTVVQIGVIRTSGWIEVIPTIPIIIYWILVWVYNFF